MRWQSIFVSFLGLQTFANARTLGSTEEYEFDEQSSEHGRLLVQASQTNAEFSIGEVNSALAMINTERRYVAQHKGGSDLIELKVNWNLTKALQRFIKLGGADWGYLDADVPPPSPGYNHYTNFHLINKNATFLNIAKEYSGLYELVTKNDIDVAHDTYRDNALQIVRLRVNQRDCLNYSKCVNNNPLTFANFQPCSTYPNVDKLPEHCLWFYWYYARFVLARAKEFAFVKLHRPGRFVVNHSQTQAWLIALILDGHKEQINNVPYQVGGAASKCPVDFPGNNKGLCVSVPTNAPTFTPTNALTLVPTAAPSTIAPSTRVPTNKPSLRHG
jgi:hypothetical protein